jgi:DNA ligase 1
MIKFLYFSILGFIMQYKQLVECYDKLESTSKRLEKTYYISELLKKTSMDDLQITALLLQGKIFPGWDESKIGVASRLILKAINVASGTDIKKVEDEWKKTGDLGKVAENLIGKKSQSTLFSKDLSVKKVFENLRKLATLEGKGTVDKKIKLIAELLTSATPKESKYIVRTVLEELRVGVGEGSLRDALIWAYVPSVNIEYNKEENKIDLSDEERKKYNEASEKVQHAFDITNEFAIVATALKKDGLKGLKDISLIPGKPIKAMLFQKAKDIEDAFKGVGKPAALEYKYDGFRLQIHKTNEEIILYTRRLENVTKQFPEVANYVEKNVKGKSFILDTEAVGFDSKTGKYLPFQSISQRIRRKYDIDVLAKKYPVELNIFDIIHYNGENLLKKPFKERRKLLEKITKQIPKKIVLAKQLITDDIKEADKFYKESLKRGEEGIMVKNLNGIYKPGSRVGYGMKVKPVMEPLDLVIVGAEWGQGKRSGWLTSYTIACLKDEEYLEIGKVGTGIKELEGSGVSFSQLTEMLKKIITVEKGNSVKVKPKIIIEVDYEEIQKSPKYSSGYALRFPRLVRLREDKALDEISTLEMVEKFYKQQSR